MSGDKKKPNETVKTNKIPLQTIIGVTIAVIYSAYLYDKSAFESYAERYYILRPASTFFFYAEKYSPFHEFINDDRDNDNKGPIIITAEQLKRYDGKNSGLPIYLGFLGKIYDVSSGAEHYGVDGGYSFFSGRDASRAFVTGNFGDDGLTDDLTGFALHEYFELITFVEMYSTKYVYVGKVIGRYYDSEGRETEYNREVQKAISDAKEEREEEERRQKAFPPCNMEWKDKSKLRVWCTQKSGGVKRSWVGVPRKFQFPGKSERCACIKNIGPPTLDTSASTTGKGDLELSYLNEYPDCDPNSASCVVSGQDASNSFN